MYCWKYKGVALLEKCHTLQARQFELDHYKTSILNLDIAKLKRIKVVNPSNLHYKTILTDC